MRRRPTAAAIAILAAGVLLSACSDGVDLAACRVDVTTPDLVEDREAAGVADCDPEAWAGGGGEPADLPDVELDCLGSTATASLADITGPAVINFWASNCGPCREELPVLQEFSELYGDQVPVIGVDFLETYPAAAIDLLGQTGATYASLADACGDLQETDLAVTSLPHFVLVAPDGSITERKGGVDTLEEIVTLAEEGTGVELADPEDSRTGQPGSGAR